MPRPNARIEERVNARVDAIAVAREHQRACVDAVKRLRAAESALRIAEHQVRDAERHLCELVAHDEQRVRELRSLNELDCAA